jgi:hypothetical protein
VKDKVYTMNQQPEEERKNIYILRELMEVSQEEFLQVNSNLLIWYRECVCLCIWTALSVPLAI